MHSVTDPEIQDVLCQRRP